MSLVCHNLAEKREPGQTRWDRCLDGPVSVPFPIRIISHPNYCLRLDQLTREPWPQGSIVVERVQICQSEIIEVTIMKYIYIICLFIIYYLYRYIILKKILIEIQSVRPTVTCGKI